MSKQLETPQNLNEWSLENMPAENLFFRDNFAGQVFFVQNFLLRALYGDNFPKIRAIDIMVIATHISKSVILPVYQFTLPNGVRITMRNNFYDWKVSVDSPFSISMKPMGLFDPKQRISSCFCEGFPSQMIFEGYAQNPRQFTLGFPTDYHFWTFMFLLGNAMMLSR